MDENIGAPKPGWEIKLLGRAGAELLRDGAKVAEFGLLLESDSLALMHLVVAANRGVDADVAAPADPKERAAWKTRTFAQRYGVGGVELARDLVTAALPGPATPAAPPTDAEISDDELRDVISEARAWTYDGAVCNIPDELNNGLSNLAEGYVEGVIAERLRNRELMRRWAAALARGNEYALIYYETPGNCSTWAALEKTESDIRLIVGVLDEARELGFVP